jgi:hypothetical protein
MEATMVDHTAEIATLRQKLAAAEARTQGVGRHNAAEADKDKIKLLPSRKSENAKSNPTLDETKSTPTLDDLSERMAALLRDLNAVRERMATLLRDLSKDAQATTPPTRPRPRCELGPDHPAESEVQSTKFMMLDDDAAVPFSCPACGDKIEKTVDWLKLNEQMICNCGNRINVDAKKVIAGIEKVERLLQATFKKLP